MANTLWSRFWESKKHPWNQPTYDPRKSVFRDGVDVTAGGQIPLEVRTPYQISTDPDRGLLAAQEVVKQRAAQEIVKQRAAQEAYDKSNHPGEYPGQPSKPPAANQGDKFDQWLKMRFIQDLIAGTAGGDPPQPYTVKVGSVREWKPLNMYGRGLA